MLNKVRAIDYASKRVYALGPNDTIAHARRLLLRYRISRLVVVNENERPIGMISLRDLLSAMSKLGRSYNRDLDEILVSEVMSKNIITLLDDVSIEKVCRVMLGRNIGSIVLTDSEGDISGIFTKTDATRAYADHAHGKVLVKDAMRRIMTTVNRFQSLRKLAELFIDERADIVVVVDNRIPIGVVKLSNLALVDESKWLPPKMRMKRMRGIIEGHIETGGKVITASTAEEIMTPIDNAVSFDDDLAKAASLMLKYRIAGIPVINEYGELTGLVTKSNIIDVIANM